jgi:hypothetical protein
MDVGSFVAKANAEIRAADAAHEIRQAERERLRRPVTLIDHLINDLEQLNLGGAGRVPLAYEPRLRQLRGLLAGLVDEQQLAALRARVRPVKLMDALYTVQEALFARTHPDVPRELPESDGGPLVTAA